METGEVVVLSFFVFFLGITSGVVLVNELGIIPIHKSETEIRQQACIDNGYTSVINEDYFDQTLSFHNGTSLLGCSKPIVINSTVTKVTKWIHYRGIED